MSDCLNCNRQHSSLPKSSFLIWLGYMLVLCDHGGKITSIFFQPEGRREHKTDYSIPERVRLAKPAGAS